MKKLLILLSLLVVIALAASPALAVIGGELDTEHTNVGAIVVEKLWDPENPVMARVCTATLIHPQVLVTAAHCYARYVHLNGAFDYDKVWVSFHSDPLVHEETYLDIQVIIPHPDYSGAFSTPHDVALVILEEPVPEGMGIAPTLLPGEGYMEDVLAALYGKEARDLQMTFVGYGASVFLPVPDIYLDAIRHVGTTTFFHIKPLQILTNNSGENDIQVCTGDSGGPVFHGDQDGNETLVGVLSHASLYPCDLAPHQIVIFNRLDTADALDFINNTIVEYFPPE